jgi:uncharacterized membrane protein YhaH (DUF805 family)
VDEWPKIGEPLPPPDRTGADHDLDSLKGYGSLGPPPAQSGRVSTYGSGPRGSQSQVLGALRTPLGGTPGTPRWLFFGADGRIGRATYWLGWLILYGASFVGLLGVGVVDAIVRAILGPSGVWFGIVVIALYFAVLLVANLSLWCKRWHDRGKSGWWSLIIVIPILGALWIVVELGFLPGTPGPNPYGSSATPVFSP